MEHKAFEETQVLVGAKKEYPTEEVIWDFVNINGFYENKKKRLLIVGDSITAGIYPVMDSVISPFWVVDAFTTSLPINDKDFLPTFKNGLLQSGKPYDVIHFNNGGHGLETDGEYEEAYREALALIKELHPNAKIVLATCVTTYKTEPDGSFKLKRQSWHKFTDSRDNIVRKLCSEFNFPLNDWAEYSIKIRDDHVPDGVHYTDAGSKKLAFQIAKFLR